MVCTRSNHQIIHPLVAVAAIKHYIPRCLTMDMVNPLVWLGIATVVGIAGAWYINRHYANSTKKYIRDSLEDSGLRERGGRAPRHDI